MAVTARVLGVIPARLGSTRLPRKPLHLLAGRPLLEWVWRRAVSSPLFDQVVIATDSEEVAVAARGFGAAVELTDPGHPSGTDRVAEVVQRAAYQRYETIVNLQGDEPFVAQEHLSAAAALVTGGGWDVGTVAAPLSSGDEWKDPNVVKVARADDGGALYFSRASIPFPRDEAAGPALPDPAFLRHIGIYAYRRAALLRWVALPEGALERLERLEQLRPLAAGVRIGVAAVGPAEPGVDTLQDAQRAEQRLRALQTIE